MTADIVQLQPRRAARPLVRRRRAYVFIATPPAELPAAETLPAWARVLILICLSVGLWAMIWGGVALVAGA